MQLAINPTHLRSDGWVDNRPTLLIADDDVTVRTMLGAQLGGEYNLVAAAANTADAIALAGKFQPDLAVIDVQMPGGGARVGVPGIFRCSPGTRMVVLSIDESRELVLELLEAGAVAYMRKGASMSEITSTLARALDSRDGSMTGDPR